MSPSRLLPSSFALSDADAYLKRILNAKVYEVAKESALERAQHLSRRLNNQIWFKREDQQSIFSFKLRGAYNRMAHLSKAQLKKGVICASAGNHAQGVALGARQLGTQAIIVMPTSTPELKIEAVRLLGAQVVLQGSSYSDAAQYAQTLAQEKKLTMIHPFDDPDVIAGQGTVAMEILRQCQGPLDALFVAIGGGGLIAGVAAYVKAIRPEIKIIGVQMNDSNAMVQSIKAQKRVTLNDVGLFSDGTAVKLVGQETFRLVQQYVDEFIEVDTDAVCAAIKDVFVDTRSIVEPAGAMAVAAIKQYVKKHATQGQSYAAILCGANMNFDRLRFVAERAEVGEEREALFAVTMPEKRGNFKRFVELIGQLPGGPRNITEFNYRMHSSSQAHVFVGVSTTKGESRQLAQHFIKAGFETLDLTHDELAKAHIRHMIGGASSLISDERLLHFVFPERPGALHQFLSLLQPNWNISLFHYRNQGGDDGKILVGIQVPKKDTKAFNAFLDELAYPYQDETDHPLCRLFLQSPSDL